MVRRQDCQVINPLKQLGETCLKVIQHSASSTRRSFFLSGHQQHKGEQVIHVRMDAFSSSTSVNHREKLIQALRCSLSDGKQMNVK